MHLVMRYLCFFGIVKRQGVKRRMDKRSTSEEQKSGYLGPVSYTHLDVYKRQDHDCEKACGEKYQRAAQGGGDRIGTLRSFCTFFKKALVITEKTCYSRCS